MPDWQIPLTDLDYGTDETEAVVRVLQSKWLSMGPEVETFEQEFSSQLKAGNSIAVSNGTAALHLALLALGIGPGDSVVQPAINFVASANMTVAVGAKPVFADITSLDEPMIDPEEIKKLINSDTRAIIVMHYGGYLCQMPAIQKICEDHRLFLIEDACHAVGAMYLGVFPSSVEGKYAGTIGSAGCFSFFSNKNLATGEGGMVTTGDVELAVRIRHFRSHGMTTLTWDRHRGHSSSYDVVQHGYNYRFDEIRAALGRVQLQKLLSNNQKRKIISEWYDQQLSGMKGWQIVKTRNNLDASHHLEVVISPDEATRNRAVQALREARIQSSLHYPCIPDFKAFLKEAACNVPRSREFSKRAITLPLFPTMSQTQVEQVCRILSHASKE